MAEYIEREAYIKIVKDIPMWGSVAAMFADSIPAADVAPVRHGRWGNYDPYLDGYRCSCCKLVHRSCTAYCPNCGAKMDGGAD